MKHKKECRKEEYNNMACYELEKLRAFALGLELGFLEAEDGKIVSKSEVPEGTSTLEFIAFLDAAGERSRIRRTEGMPFLSGEILFDFEEEEYFIGGACVIRCDLISEKINEYLLQGREDYLLEKKWTKSAEREKYWRDYLEFIEKLKQTANYIIGEIPDKYGKYIMYKRDKHSEVPNKEGYKKFLDFLISEIDVDLIKNKKLPTSLL